MIARSALPFTFRNILDRVGLASAQQRVDLTRAVPLSRWQRAIAALGDWSAVSNVAWRREILLHDRPRRRGDKSGMGNSRLGNSCLPAIAHFMQRVGDEPGTG